MDDAPQPPQMGRLLLALYDHAIRGAIVDTTPYAKAIPRMSDDQRSICKYFTGIGIEHAQDDDDALRSYTTLASYLE
jgi:hypothetical protein